MSTREKLYIIVPAYNEEENLDLIINQWYPIIEDIGENSRLVIIDDGSKDHTYDILLKAQEQHPLLQPLTKSNGGHGSTVLFGYRYAIEHQANWIFQTDSDGRRPRQNLQNFGMTENCMMQLLVHDRIVRMG